MISIRAFPRIHIGLVDLGNATARRFGGAGFMLNTLPTEVSVDIGKERRKGWNLIDKQARVDISTALQRLNCLGTIKNAALEIRQIAPQHIGLGTKTSLILAVLQAYAKLNDLSTSSATIKTISGRGGASGIGVHGFFTGGFIVDAGHSRNTDNAFLPSSSQSGKLATLVARYRIPTRWRFALFVPPGKKCHGGQELNFFQKNTPIPKQEVFRTLSSLYHGVVPAVIEDDIQKLKIAISDMQSVGFKHRELGQQTAAVKGLLRDLDQIPDCAVGMSSLGPLVYAITNDSSSELLNEFHAIARAWKTKILAVCSGRNRGYEVV